NVLFHDDGFRGVVIRMHSLGGFDLSENGSDFAKVTVGAGIPLQAVISRTARLAWTGTEDLWGIPGSFGGAIATNAGSGHTSMGPLLQSIRAINGRGEEVLMSRGDFAYGYRSMDLPIDTVVLEGTIVLQRSNPTITQARLEKARLRRASQPIGRFSAGCVFKNPAPGRSAGALIDRLGLKGTTIGDAQVSEVHANFIINRGSAKATDVLQLIEKIRERVKAEENIDLEAEIQVVGAEPKDD
ncbi:UDP-N-acetylmuramate dehydrogenase, partial [Thermodesulfobacteriota bacterium]